jgi:hypothetical protein
MVNIKLTAATTATLLPGRYTEALRITRAGTTYALENDYILSLDIDRVALDVDFAFSEFKRDRLPRIQFDCLIALYVDVLARLDLERAVVRIEPKLRMRNGDRILVLGWWRVIVRPEQGRGDRLAEVPGRRQHGQLLSLRGNAMDIEPLRPQFGDEYGIQGDRNGFSSVPPILRRTNHRFSIFFALMHRPVAEQRVQRALDLGDAGEQLENLCGHSYS